MTDAPPAPFPGWWAVSRSRWGPVPAWLVAATLGSAVLLLGWQGTDLPAQVFRVASFRRDGFSIWNGQWYGGHHTPSYSLLFPALGAVVGVGAVGLGSAVACAFCFERLARGHFGSRATLGAVWFAAATAANLAVGRLAFSLGLAFALGTLLALQKRRRWLALGLALLCPLSSPLAAAFLALAVGAWGLAGRRLRRSDLATRRTGWAVLATALAPVAVLALAFPEGGRFPFAVGGFVLDVVVGVVLLRLLPRDQPTLRAGTVVYLVVCTAAFLVATPVGGNVSRLAMMVAGPLLALVVVRRRALLLAVLGPPLLWWQWAPVLEAAAGPDRDPSIDAAYYEPLVSFLRSQGAATARTEVVFTRRHWETAYVAPYVPLARGWERQLDLRYNTLFYEPGLGVGRYRRWLVDNAVRFVALPDAPLDESGLVEAELLRAGVPGLRPVWRDANWQVWEVDGTRPMVEGPATLAETGPDWFALDVTGPGEVVVRLRYTSHWAVGGGGRAGPTAHGWTRVWPTGPGRVEIKAVVARWPSCEVPALSAIRELAGCP